MAAANASNSARLTGSVPELTPVSQPEMDAPPPATATAEEKRYSSPMLMNACRPIKKVMPEPSRSPNVSPAFSAR